MEEGSFTGRWGREKFQDAVIKNQLGPLWSLDEPTALCACEGEARAGETLLIPCVSSLSPLHVLVPVSHTT